MRKYIRPLSLAVLLAVGAASQALAQAYPSRPITLLVPAAAGGPTDAVSRMIAESMGRTLNAQVVVENVGGAGGTIGMARVAKAPADGYTVSVWHIAQATAPTLYENLRYNVINDFDSIGRIADVPMTIVGKANLEPKTASELIAWVKQKKDVRDLRPCRRRFGVTSVRADVHERARFADDWRVVSRHRPGDDRSARRPVRHDVRPDHDHHGADP